MRVKINYVAVLPGGSEIPYEDFEDSRYGKKSLQDICEEVVRRSKIRRQRGTQDTVPIQLFRLEIVGLQIARVSAGVHYVMPPAILMTKEEYAGEAEDALIVLPVEFRAFVISSVEERSSGSNYEHKIQLINELVESLKPAIEQFQYRVQRQSD